MADAPTVHTIMGIDVGGTFTDFVLLDRASGQFTSHKQPSTPADPAAAVALGISAVLARASATPDTVRSCGFTTQSCRVRNSVGVRFVSVDLTT